MTAKLAFTCGDPAGVGPEVIETWLAAHRDEAADVAVIGPTRWLDTLKTSASKIPVGLEEFAAVPGKPTGEGALIAWAALERAAGGCKTGEFCGVVTAPISKEWVSRIGYPYPGHTEFFAARWGGDPVMGFCGGRLIVVLATWHVPLNDVAGLLTPPLLKRTVAAANELARVFAKPEKRASPRIAVCGLTCCRRM